MFSFAADTSSFIVSFLMHMSKINLHLQFEKWTELLSLAKETFVT